MAHLLILTHQHDGFTRNHFVLNRYINYWVADGHRVSVAEGPENLPDADAVFVHVDLSVVPQVYMQAASRYPVVINGAVRDIRKSTFSRNLVRPGDDWAGPVIVKTDLNCHGLPEQKKRKVARMWRFRKVLFAIKRTIPFTGTANCVYPIYSSLADVPELVWSDPGLVAERFLPEMDARGFWTHSWVFLGDREGCFRILSDQAIVKAGNAREFLQSVVPDEIRAERARLGFDFGKFDFVIHEGRPILLDVNKTPGAPPVSMDRKLAAIYRNAAAGLGALLKRGAQTI